VKESQRLERRRGRGENGGEEIAGLLVFLSVYVTSSTFPNMV